MRTRRSFSTFFFTLLVIGTCSARFDAQTTSFIYQGRLNDAGAPANGNYDFTFTLYATADPSDRNPVAPAVGVTLAVANGIFSTNLDFGNVFNGADRYLEIMIRQGGGGIFTILSPRVRFTSVPYSVRSLSAAGADTAQNASQLGGVAASQYVVATDPRLTDARPPASGSPDYIQNSTATQPSTNFNIGGNGTVGGTLSGNIVNATTQYNINGNRVLGIAGTNVFVGHGTTGASNTSGLGNSFFGYGTGITNSTGGGNSFFGGNAGYYNNGGGNSFVGASAGFNNTTGRSNSFFGYDSGGQNATGSGNTFIGSFSGTSANNLTNATAIGFEAVVETSNSLILGSIAGVGGCLPVNNCSDTNVGIGTTAPTTRLHVVSAQNPGFQVETSDTSFAEIQYKAGNYIWRSGVGGTNVANGAANKYYIYDINAGQFRMAIDTGGNVGIGTTAPSTRLHVVGDGLFTGNLNVNGTLSAPGLSANIINAGTEFQIGGTRVFKVGSSSTSTFAGVDSGASITLGVDNSFFGNQAGMQTSGGSENAFFGTVAGKSNSGGLGNSYFGSGSGTHSSTGQYNAFFGFLSGLNDVSTGKNSFFGATSGQNNNVGTLNAFFGYNAGISNTDGSSNTILGAGANVGSGTLSNATAIGANASVTQNNSLVLGSINGVNGASADTNVGIGITAPTAKLHVVGNTIFSGNLTVSGTFSGNAAAQFVQTTDSRLSDARNPLPNSANYIQNTTSAQSSTNFNISGNGTAGGTLSAIIINAATQYNLGGARLISAPGSSTFVGMSAGGGNSGGQNNTFVGTQAGQINSGESGNTFIGSTAGEINGSGDTTNNANNNTFVGSHAGFNNWTGGNNSFFGNNAGLANQIGNNNTLIGYSANVGADGLTNATAIGTNASVTQSNSLVLGSINGVNGATADTKVGIGTTTPHAKLQVTGGSVYVTNPNTLIITSPNGACWGITVSNTGVVSAFSTPCP